MNLVQRLKIVSRPTRAIIQASVGFFMTGIASLCMAGGARTLRMQARLPSRQAVSQSRKSLCFGLRKQGSGWAVADELIALLEKAKSSGTTGYQEIIAANVLMKFREAEVGPVAQHRSQAITLLYEYFCSKPVVGGGCVEITAKRAFARCPRRPRALFLDALFGQKFR